MTVTDSHGCHGTDGVLVTVAGGPLGVTAMADPGTVCAGNQSQLDALVSGGSGNYTYTWNSNPPGFSSTLRNPVVFPLTTTTYAVQAGDGFSSISDQITVSVHPLPVASAGSNTSVPFGTQVTLNGSATGGSGTYSFSWTSLPPGYSSAVASPQFVNLSQTTIFSLVVTDQLTGCQSEPSLVTVTVTGSPLACQPVASQPVVCRGIPVTLHAMAGGGSGNYTYTWSSVPSGFTSSLSDPVVTPGTTTVYTLTLYDGFNSATGHVTVTVKPVPLFPGWHSDTTVCIYEKVTLDAGNPGSVYYWSNGSTSQNLTAQSTGIGYDMQHYRVLVTNDEGCSDSAFATIEFSFSACMGVEEAALEGLVRIIPNPAGEVVRFEFRGSGQTPVVRLISVSGVIVHAGVMEPCGNGVSGYTCRLTGLPSGLYVVEFRSDNAISRSKLMVRHP